MKTSPTVHQRRLAEALTLSAKSLAAGGAP